MDTQITLGGMTADNLVTLKKRLEKAEAKFRKTEYADAVKAIDAEKSAGNDGLPSIPAQKAKDQALAKAKAFQDAIMICEKLIKGIKAIEKARTPYERLADKFETLINELGIF